MQVSVSGKQRSVGPALRSHIDGHLRDAKRLRPIKRLRVLGNAAAAGRARAATDEQ
jgi:hypothetical protein